MAVRSEALPLTASCLSPLFGFEILLAACEKVASDLGLGDGFRRLLRLALPFSTV